MTIHRYELVKLVLIADDFALPFISLASLQVPYSIMKIYTFICLLPWNLEVFISDICSNLRELIEDCIYSLMKFCMFFLLPYITEDKMSKYTSLNSMKYFNNLWIRDQILFMEILWREILLNSQIYRHEKW